MKATLSKAFEQTEADAATGQQSAWSGPMAEFWHGTGDLPHYRVRRTPPRPRVLRGPHRRQPRPRPPRNVELIFKRHPGGRKAAGTFKTAIDRHAHGVTLNVFYKHSRVKQYLKDGRALRIETVVNDAYDIDCRRLLPNLDDLQAKARAINQRLLDTERVGQGTVLASPAFARIAQPTVTNDGRRAPALRFGEPRVQALAGAIANQLFAVTDITNTSLRAQMTGLLGTPYSMNQASYDLTRLRLNGPITRIPGHHRYTLTADGIQFAIFYTKVHDRVLQPLLATWHQPHTPPELRTIHHAVDQRIANVRLRPAA
jgi:hypothetical protein